MDNPFTDIRLTIRFPKDKTAREDVIPAMERRALPRSFPGCIVVAVFACPLGQPQNAGE